MHMGVSAHVRMVGLECAKLQPPMEDICITYFSDRENIPQHGFNLRVLRVTAARQGISTSLPDSKSSKQCKAFFSMPSLKLVAIRQVGMRTFRDR